MKERILLSFMIIFIVLICFPSTHFMTAYPSDDFLISATSYIHEIFSLNENQHRIEHRSGLFENPGDLTPVCHIDPQVITIIEQQENWALINTWLGQLWVNLDFSPSTEELDNLISRHGSNLALLFQNLETGFVYTYNPDLVLFGASLNKINHALYVYTLAERGYISMDTIHTFTEADRRGGTGRIQNMAVGTRFTTRELLQHSIIHSCNVAYRMLIRHTTNAEFSYHDFVQELGANTYFIGNISSQNTNVHDKALWMNAVHSYIWSEGTYSHHFREDLLATTGFIQADYPMARKYGWATASFHDAAIVYADSPYILIILSNFDDGAAGTFRNISLEIQEFNRTWF